VLYWRHEKEKIMILYGRWIARSPFARPGSPFLYAAVRDTRTGRVHTISTRTTKAKEAKKALSDYVDELQARETGGIVKSVTLAAAVEEFLSLKTDLRPVSLRALRYDLEAYAAALGAQKHLEDLRPEDLERWFAGLALEGQAPRTREKALAALRAVFTWAMRRRYIYRDPTEGLKAPRVPRYQGRALSLEEARELVATARGELRLAILLALHAGLRVGTIARLRWRDVDFAGRRLTIPGESMKGGEPVVLPIHPELQDALISQLKNRESPDAHVSPFSLVISIRLDGTLGDLGWHDLRRTFATWYGLRVSHAVLQALLAHAPGDVTDLYPKIPFEDLRAAVEAAPWIGRTKETKEGVA
jgi:integrase